MLTVHMKNYVCHQYQVFQDASKNRSLAVFIGVARPASKNMDKKKQVNQPNHNHGGAVGVHRGLLKIAAGAVLALLIVVSYLLGDLPTATYLHLLGSENLISDFDYLNESIPQEREGYLIWSPNCRLPDIPEKHESILNMIKHSYGPPPKCPGSILSYISSSSPRTLHLKPTLISNTTTCCVSQITRVHSISKSFDDKYRVSKCNVFENNFTLPNDTQFIKIKCTKGTGKTRKELYHNVHAIISETQESNKKLIAQSSDPKKNDKLSVLIIGIDSVSRLNMIRTMPKTTKYLNDHGWINLKGYNKIDDNTFPNLIAFLTGHTVPQLRMACWPTAQHKLDECPFVWKDFSKENYITVYGEDEPDIGSFNYHKAGFMSSPTDYYMRPFMLAAVKNLKIKLVDNLKICMGPNYSVDLLLNYSLELVKHFKDALHFSLFWMNSFSHNDLNRPSSFDNKMLKYWKDLEKTGALNNTFIVFVSDHGMRFGKIRQTYVGWLEERLPFIYFWIPENFRKANPEKYKNFITNTYRLTSPFDLYLTYQDLLGNSVNGTVGCQKCSSLFNEITWNRSCMDAGITDHWCTCSDYKTLSVHSNGIRALVKFVAQELNAFIGSRAEFLNNGSSCAHLGVKRILDVRSKVFSYSVGYQEFVVLIETKPGGGLFEATVRQKKSFELIDSISRINAYSNQSSCVNDAVLRKYCYCQSKE